MCVNFDALCGVCGISEMTVLTVVFWNVQLLFSQKLTICVKCLLWRTTINSACVSWASISSDTAISCLILEGMIYFSVLQEGGVNSSARAYPMIVAIVTSRSGKRGILLSFENGAGDVVGC